MKVLIPILLLFILTIESSSQRIASFNPAVETSESDVQLPKPIEKKQSFDILKNGFSFPNYTNKDSPLNLTENTLQRLCGSEVCARGVDATCVLSGSIRLFLDYANRSMNPGHCDGMSVLAQAIFEGHVSLDDLDENAETTFSLQFASTRVQSEIAYWFAKQMTYPGWTELKLKPSEVVERLKDEDELYSIGVRTSDLDMGHAITPAKLIQESPTVYRVQVYDSDYPGDTNQFVTIDTEQETWSFAEFYGDEYARSLTLSPLSKKIQQQKCPTLSDDSRWEVWLDGDGDLDVPKGSQTISRAARLLGEGLDPMYLIDSDEDVDISIVADADSQEQPASVVIFRPGQAFALEGIKLDKNEKDELKLAKDHASIRYSTKDDEKVRIRIAYTYEGADYEIVVLPDDNAKGFEINLENVVGADKLEHKLKLRMSTYDNTLATFRIEMTRIGDKSDEVFSYLERDFELKKNETVTIEYGKWARDKEPLSILRDFDSDGRVDASASLADDS